MKKINFSSREIRFVFLIIIFGCVLAKPIYTVLQSHESLTFKEVSEYRSLFGNSKNLKFLNTVQSGTHEAISQYIYKDTFKLILTKIKSQETFDLHKNIKIINGKFNVDSGELRYPLKFYHGQIHMKSEKSGLVNNIKLEIEGEDPQISYNKPNEICYNFNFKNFAIDYDNSPNQIVGNSDNVSSPINIMFLKKDEGIYLIIMILNDKGDMKPDLLTNIIN